MVPSGAVRWMVHSGDVNWYPEGAIHLMVPSVGCSLDGSLRVLFIGWYPQGSVHWMIGWFPRGAVHRCFLQGALHWMVPPEGLFIRWFLQVAVQWMVLGWAAHKCHDICSWLVGKVA